MKKKRRHVRTSVSTRVSARAHPVIVSPSIQILTKQPNGDDFASPTFTRAVVITNASGGMWQGDGWAYGNTAFIAHDASNLDVQNELRATQGTNVVIVGNLSGLLPNQTGWRIIFGSTVDAAAFTVDGANLT